MVRISMQGFLSLAASVELRETFGDLVSTPPRFRGMRQPSLRDRDFLVSFAQCQDCVCLANTTVDEYGRIDGIYSNAVSMVASA